MFSKNQVNRRNIFSGKNALFLKSLTAFYKEISERDPDFYERKLEV